jgi:transposase-like protein
MLGYLASAWSCPRCETSMSAVPGKADSRYCFACGETFQLQVGYLLATGITLNDIDLTVRTNLTSIDLKRDEVTAPIEAPI